MFWCECLLHLITRIVAYVFYMIFFFVELESFNNGD